MQGSLITYGVDFEFDQFETHQLSNPKNVFIQSFIYKDDYVEMVVSL